VRGAGVALDFGLGARAGNNDAPAPPCVFKKSDVKNFCSIAELIDWRSRVIS
jgi:hypothetical protein